MTQMVKNLPAMQETWVPSLGWEDALEDDMATHASILAWRIPRTEEAGRYSPWGHKGSDVAQPLTHMRFPKLASGRQERHGEWQEPDSGDGGTALYR